MNAYTDSMIGHNGECVDIISPMSIDYYSFKALIEVVIAQNINIDLTEEASYHPRGMPLRKSADHQAQTKDDRDQLLHRKRNMKALLSWGLIATIFVLTSARRFDSAKVFRAKPHNEQEVSFMKHLFSTMQLHLWFPDSALHIVSQRVVDFHVSADQSKTVQTLMEQNSIQILFQNLQDDIEKQLDNGRNSTDQHSYTKYNEWHKISAWTARIAEENPKLVSRIQIGNTFEKRPIYLLKVGKGKDSTKAIFIDCGVHAREWISPAFCQWFLKEATRTYGKNQNMTNMLDNLNFYILPLANVDGYIWSWTQDRLWRKNRSNTSQSDCVGVDINRNFDIAWGTIDASSDPCEEIYCGTSAESEQETKAITAFIRSHLSSIKAYVSIHSYSQMLLYPYGYRFEKTPNHDELNEIAKGAAEAISSLYGTEYTYGASAVTIYPSSGCSDDWAYNQGIKYSFTFELRDKGKYGFLLPEHQIKPTCEEIMLAVKYLANYILSHTS
ncbi:mast cell carboxypeptidase A-like isoform X2 [Hemicordylus capensis]|uniref:mast cell carboxypeptidase A-like isoform X2 n=1 Tax=Hemicordylus capensis TaxID=884348 RepID=UPI002302437C|nr:mast cell carboxypeptidase A-like isoform X2 [Hemicordylus capensis]